MNTKFYIHLGLHKTGTKFFQHKVFPNLDNNKFIYNPTKMAQLVCDLMKAFDEDLEMVVNEIKKEKADLESQYPEHKFIISREILSGDLFSLYKNCENSVSRLHKAFFDSEIIYSKRYQVDWIVSCYRESVHEHHYQSIEDFLSLKNVNEGFVNNKYSDLDFHKYENLLINKFGNSKLHLLYYENFKVNKELEVQKIAKIIGAGSIDIKHDNDGQPNRGYSAFAIKLSIFRYKICKIFGISKYFIHRPIVFFGPKGIPAGYENLSVLPKDKYWHQGFLRDNEEIRSYNYPNLSKKEARKFRWSWRRIIKNGIDKLFYWDWDMLGKYRVEMDTYFNEQNKKNMPKDAPEKYFK